MQPWALSEMSRSIRIVLAAGTLICDASAPTAATHNQTTRPIRTQDTLELNGFIVMPFNYSQDSFQNYGLACVALLVGS